MDILGGTRDLLQPTATKYAASRISTCLASSYLARKKWGKLFVVVVLFSFACLPACLFLMLYSSHIVWVEIKL